MQIAGIYAEYVQLILFFGLLGVALLAFAGSKGYFLLSHAREITLSFKSLIVVFAIYLSMTILVAPLLIRFIASFIAPTLSLVGWVQLFTFFAVFLLIFLFCRANQPTVFKRIWKDWSIPNPKPITQDFLMGILTWLLSFPLVIAIGQFSDLLVYFFFGVENYEQVAVRYLKNTLASPEMLVVALFTILIAAPILEEFLFRGCLQTFFKRFMHPKTAICLSSCCFALFHYAPSQGIGNISLVISLFSFALFLGFIYERQSSLFASIGLHMTFNAVSAFRILFYPEG